MVCRVVCLEDRGGGEKRRRIGYRARDMEQNVGGSSRPSEINRDLSFMLGTANARQTRRFLPHSRPYGHGHCQGFCACIAHMMMTRNIRCKIHGGGGDVSLRNYGPPVDVQRNPYSKAR